ncbi:polymeric immunoglobulin receptor-like [Pangasianodon hypophthalmus]|uniref:polymeric immunoglobulin receptor-like n=1 Tax=Pangasianodon hypophthalmus TaxID=310915 RepID=UPI002307C510|nr:polymeric immunoglobulin receptor-like [Pangasianodon hypophthalmus]
MSCFFIFILVISSAVCQASREFSIKTGASVTIPCHYDRTYIQYKKYWCHGGTFDFCKIQAYANNTKGKVTVTDYPAESLFTVTMNNLQTGNTGWYWCVVEISGPDVKEYLYITVKSDPDLSVRNSRVRGEEGGSVTVQCFYSAAYQNTQKQWCRFKDGRCNTFRKTATSQNSAVNISDDGRRSFSVQMSGLTKSDAGWYWCSAGDLQVPVNISVHDPPPDPDLSVRNSRVSGEEGGSVTVQCLYSAAYQNTQKQWCRLKDGRCNTFKKTATSQNSAVNISDDGRRSLSVQMSGLKKSDAGWYWCSAGDLQVPVHISVHDPPPVVTTAVTTTVTTAVTTTTHHVSTYTSVSKHNSAASVTAVSSSHQTIKPVEFCIAHN